MVKSPFRCAQQLLQRLKLILEWLTLLLRQLKAPSLKLNTQFRMANSPSQVAKHSSVEDEHFFLGWLAIPLGWQNTSSGMARQSFWGGETLSVLAKIPFQVGTILGIYLGD